MQPWTFWISLCFVQEHYHESHSGLMQDIIMRLGSDVPVRDSRSGTVGVYWDVLVAAKALGSVAATMATLSRPIT